MKKKTAGLLAILGLLLSACGASSADPAGGGFGEAIAVHGNWTIDVLNADGSIDGHHEFQNAFTGAFALAPVLAMNKVVDGWRVKVIGDADLCDDLFADCEFNSDPGTGAPNLVVTEDEINNELVLTGSVAVDVAGNVTDVEGLMKLCDPGVSCSNSRAFSEKTLAAPIPVAAGQIVQVEVRYSFG